MNSSAGIAVGIAHAAAMSALIAFIALAGLGLPDDAAAKGNEPGQFYSVTPAELAGKPGSLIRAEPWNLKTLYKANVYRVLYRSKGLKGEPIAVSGSVVVPEFSAPPGGRPIVAWAHPTTGVARECAPSLQQSPFDAIPGITDMIPPGYLIVATDYEGLGAPGIHPYLVGVSAARSVLDSVRAARELLGAEASNRFVVWGHSQGGHAALYTGQLADEYAPELKLEGVAAAAPASELINLLDADYLTDDGKILTSMALASWSKVFNHPLQSVVADIPGVEAIAAGCLNTVGGALGELGESRRLPETYLKVDPTEVEPWRKLMTENTPGQAPAGAPVFILQGTSDTIVRPKITRKFVKELCRRGDKVEFITLQGVDHGLAARKGASRAVNWITDRFSGKPAQSNCGL